MKRILACMSLVALAACGADGEPIQPSMNANVGIGSAGVSGSTGVTMKRGPFSVGLGTGF